MTKKKVVAVATFAEALSNAEQCAAQLESGDLALEAALAVYEKGVAALQVATSLLNQTEAKIQIITPDGNVAATDFKPE